MKSRPQSPHPDKLRFWSDIVQRSLRSHLSTADFCRSNHLALPTFYAWRRRLRQLPRCSANAHVNMDITSERGHNQPTSEHKATTLPLFVPLPATADSPLEMLTPNSCDIFLPTGLRVRVALDADGILLRRLVAALNGGEPC